MLPSNRGNLGVKLGWGFLLEPRPLKSPCLVERGWVVGGTGVFMPGLLNCAFSLLPYFLLDQFFFPP